MGALKIFVSYSRDDIKFRKTLEEHLAHLVDVGLVELWHDSLVGAGKNWERQISTNLETAQIILLLVSPSFNASRYIQGRELKRAIEKHDAGEAVILPIFIRPVGAIDLLPFGHIQALPIDGRLKPVSDWPNQDAAWVQVTERLRVLADAARGSQADLPLADALATWSLAESLAMFHVDLMRLFVVLFGKETNAVNSHRLVEFFETAEEQAATVDHHIFANAGDVTPTVKREAVALRGNMSKTLAALRHRERDRQSLDVLLANLRNVAERIDRLLLQSSPGLHQDIVETVGEALVGESDDTRKGSHDVDAIAYRRFRAQESYLAATSRLRSIANDFDQTLAVPYFTIDRMVLAETAA